MEGKESSAHPRIIQMAAKTGKYQAGTVIRRWAPAGVILVAILFRVALLLNRSYPFNSDEAIVALMARHTLSGQWPVFFYGQAYMGSLDATLVASGFTLFGQNVWVIRFVQLLLFTGTLFTSMQLSKYLTRSFAGSMMTGVLLAIPTVNLNLYSTVSLGGYGEALLIGNLLLLLSIRLDGQDGRNWLLFLWGLLAGIGFWAFGLTLVYSLPAFIMLAAGRQRGRIHISLAHMLLLIAFGFLLGISPILFWVASNNPAVLMRELFGAAIAGTSTQGVWPNLLNHLLNFILFGVSAIFGLRPPWSPRIFFWPLSLGVALFWVAVVIQYIRMLKGKGGQVRAARLLGGLMLTLIAGFFLTPFGADPSGRYFLPITVMATVIAGGLVADDSDWFPRWLKWVLFSIVIAYQLSSNLYTTFRSETGFSTQFDAVARINHEYDDELMEFLNRVEATRGYTNYWVAYPLAFKSAEELVFVPRLPYHQDLRYTPRDNRYAPYNSIVEASDHVAYITTNNPELDQRIRSGMRKLGVTWQERMIGDYQIFYQISERVEPGEIDSRFSR